MPETIEKLTLHGFNNLTKTLSFNIYDVCYAESESERAAYIEYINKVYNADRLTEILEQVADIIDADILNIARQDYDPQGASVTMLVCEEPINSMSETEAAKAEPGPIPEDVVAHLNKSHLTVHTYPEQNPESPICSFRVDIDVSTCGVISPLKALNFLIHSFESDVVILDYRVRGFTRDISARKHFIDHRIDSIQDFMTEDTKAIYQMRDVNIDQEKLFHTKMMLREFNLDNYLFAKDKHTDEGERAQISRDLRDELLELYHGFNL